MPRPWSSAISMLALATGCASWLPAPTPMRTVSNRAYATKQARCLLVLLPGRGDSDADFAEHGFIDAIRARRLSVDTISANATLGYYAKQTVLARLETDVLAPALAARYEQIWLAGVSLGGMGALILAKHHPREVTGVLGIAPWLGEDKVLDEIEHAGGLARWNPPASLPRNDYQRGVWRWLKDVTRTPQGAPKIYLAAGDRDKLKQGHRLLETALPSDRVFRTNGKHDWGSWAVLWADFLDHSSFKEDCREL